MQDHLACLAGARVVGGRADLRLVDTAIVGQLGTDNSPGWPSPPPCCRSSSSAPTSSPTARPSASPAARRRRSRRGRQRRRPGDVVSRRWSAVAAPLLFAVARPLSALLGAPTTCSTTRRRSSRSAPSACRSCSYPRLAGRAARQVRLRDAARDPARLQRRQPADRARARVRARPRRGRGRPGRPSSPRSAPRSPSPGGSDVRWARRDHRRPDRDGMAPLMTAGRTCCCGSDRCSPCSPGRRWWRPGSTADARRPSDRDEHVPVPRTDARRARRPRPDDRGRGARPRDGDTRPRSRTGDATVVDHGGVSSLCVLAALAPVLPHLFTDDQEVIDRAVAGAAVAGVVLLPARSHSPRRRADRRRRLPLPRPRRLRLPRRGDPDRRRDAARSSESPASGSG